MSNKDLVITAARKTLGERDASAVDEYFAPRYIQHSTVAGPGIEGLRALVEDLPSDFRYEPARAIAEGDFVVTHGTYHGFGPEPLVAFDLWRVENGTIAEHWDALQPEVTETASGRSMTDGPTEVTEPANTAANKQLVEQFVDTILVRGDLREFASFFDGDTYAQHNPQIPDSPAGLGGAIEALAQQGITLGYDRVHRTVAEGEFVFVQSEGTFGGAPTAFYDLFRVADGKIAEHWDVVFTIPESLPHDNGLF